MAKKIWLSTFLLLVILTSSIYFVLDDNVRIDISKTRSIFSVYEDGEWVVSGVEYVNIFDGPAKMRAKSRTLVTDIGENNLTTVTRVANYKDNISTIEVYTFDPAESNVELFPINHSVEVINGIGKLLQYEVQKLLYYGETVKDISSPQKFGHKMYVEWEDGNYYSRIYKYKYRNEGKLTVKYRIDSEDFIKNVRLFDPAVDVSINITNPVNGSTIDGSYHNITYDYSNSTPSGTCWYTNDSGATNNTITCGDVIGPTNWEDGVNVVTIYGDNDPQPIVYDATNDSSINTSLWNITFVTVGLGGTTNSGEDTEKLFTSTSGVGGGGFTSNITSIDLVPTNDIQQLNTTIKLFVLSADGDTDSATANISIFGNLVLSITTPGNDGEAISDDKSNWSIIMNETGSNLFDVYKNDSYQETITATSNVLTIFGDADGATVLTNATMELFGVEYKLIPSIFSGNVTFTTVVTPPNISFNSETLANNSWSINDFIIVGVDISPCDEFKNSTFFLRSVD